MREAHVDRDLIAEHRLLEAVRKRRREARTVDRVVLGNLHRRLTAWQRLIGPRQAEIQRVSEYSHRGTSFPPQGLPLCYCGR